MSQLTQAQLNEAIEKLRHHGVSLKELKKAARAKIKASRPPRQRWSWAVDPRQKPGTCRTLSADEIRALGYEPSQE